MDQSHPILLFLIIIKHYSGHRLYIVYIFYIYIYILYNHSTTGIYKLNLFRKGNSVYIG